MVLDASTCSCGSAEHFEILPELGLVLKKKKKKKKKKKQNLNSFFRGSTPLPPFLPLPFHLVLDIYLAQRARYVSCWPFGPAGYILLA